MAENQSPPHSRDEEDAPLLAKLRQAGGALGEVVSEFTGNYRADREALAGATGEHSRPDLVTDQPTTAEQLKAAGAAARQKYSEGSGFNAVKGAAGSLAGSTGDIVRDLAGSVTRAVDATRESGASTEASEAVSGAVSSVRDRVGGAVSSVRGRLGRGHTEGDVADESPAHIIEGEVLSSETTDTPASGSEAPRTDKED